MVNLAELTVAGIIVFLFGVSLLNPGGAKAALFLSLVVVSIALLYMFLPDYILSVNKGKNARKKPQVPDKNDNSSEGRR